jgi:competence protein ComEA
MEEPQRPLPPRSTRDRINDWMAWIGFARIVGSAIAVMVVCAGAYWLVRSPPPPTEATLPHASTSLPASTVTDSIVGPSASAGHDEATSNTMPEQVVVHVAGAVVAAGVYELPIGSRIEGAIAAAGGPLADADANALNLAAPVVDGSRVYVPLVGEPVPPPVTPPTTVSSGPQSAAVVDVNEAPASELEALPGVGPATAAAIVAERERNGPFLSVDELERVAGIGPAKIEAFRTLVTT